LDEVNMSNPLPIDEVNAPLSGFDKPIIRLWQLSGIGLIIVGPSGALYTNQTGGHACCEPAAEGWFFPVTDEPSDQERKLEEWFCGPPWLGHCSRGIRPEDADFIDTLLQSSPDTAFLLVDRERLDRSHEAWVYVRIGTLPARVPSLPVIGDKDTWADKNSPINQMMSMLFGFSGYRGILTWCNSD
jgi:hypothetical protein